MTTIGVSGWTLLLVPAHPGCRGQNSQSHKMVVCVCLNYHSSTVHIYGNHKTTSRYNTGLWHRQTDRQTDRQRPIANSHPQMSRHWWSALTQQYCPHLWRPHDNFLLHRRSHVNSAPSRDLMATTSEHGSSVVWPPHRHVTSVTPSHGPHGPLWHALLQWCTSSTTVDKLTPSVKRLICSTMHCCTPGGVAVERWTCDQEVAGSMPGRSTVRQQLWASC